MIDNYLIICPQSLKKQTIKKINQKDQLVSYKIMDLEEFLKNYFFSYNKKTIFYLMRKLNLKYDIILEYLESFYYLENKKYNVTKLNDLVCLKQELEDNNLLIYNPFFHYYLNNVNIIVYGYDELDPFYKKIFSLFHFNHVLSNFDKKTYTVYEFNDIEDEIAYICHDIKEKIDTGISIDTIKLVNPSDEYLNPLKRIFKWCHIPLELESKISLYDLDIGKNLLNKIKDNMNFSDIILELQHQINGEVLNQIVCILNDYVDFDCEVKELYPMIKHDLKNTYLKKKMQKNCVTTCDLDEMTKDDYIYLLGFNKENYPTVYKDEDFLSDEMRQELGLFTSNQRNINSLNSFKRKLNQELNLLITYKLKTSFDSYNPCLLIKEENYPVISNPKISFQISQFYNQITLAKEYDNFYKYGTISETLEYLMPNYKTLPYRTYDNQFHGINHNELLTTLKKPFTLSYSTIDEYYRCGFRYYISNILNIKEENSDEFYKNIGNIFHYVLSQCFNPNFHFDESWNKEASKYVFSFDKVILLEKLKQELKYDIEILNKQKNYTYFDEYLYEKKFSIPIKNNQNISVNFTGIVDKISYLKENNRTLVAVIDYKTGHLPSNLNNIIYGIGMQLPIYLYFIKRSSLFPNLEIVGFYLQKIINKEMKAVSGKSMDELKENALKLVGYSTDKEEILEKFDMTYEDSQMISSLKKKKEGFYAYSKILSEKQMAKMDSLVEEKIETGVHLILNGDFSINPKRIDKELIGCEFCSYKDICFKTEKDYIDLEKHKDLDFLGSDDYAEMD